MLDKLIDDNGFSVSALILSLAATGLMLAPDDVEARGGGRSGGKSFKGGPKKISVPKVTPSKSNTGPAANKPDHQKTVQGGGNNGVSNTKPVVEPPKWNGKHYVFTVPARPENVYKNTPLRSDFSARGSFSDTALAEDLSEAYWGLMRAWARSYSRRHSAASVSQEAGIIPLSNSPVDSCMTKELLSAGVPLKAIKAAIPDVTSLRQKFEEQGDGGADVRLDFEGQAHKAYKKCHTFSDGLSGGPTGTW
jgi:hypothetical protein